MYLQLGIFMNTIEKITNYTVGVTLKLPNGKIIDK
jgi:hypothetical protein